MLGRIDLHHPQVVFLLLLADQLLEHREIGLVEQFLGLDETADLASVIQ